MLQSVDVSCVYSCFRLQIIFPCGRNALGLIPTLFPLQCDSDGQQTAWMFLSVQQLCHKDTATTRTKALSHKGSDSEEDVMKMWHSMRLTAPLMYNYFTERGKLFRETPSLHQKFRILFYLTFHKVFSSQRLSLCSLCSFKFILALFPSEIRFGEFFTLKGHVEKSAGFLWEGFPFSDSGAGGWAHPHPLSPRLLQSLPFTHTYTHLPFYTPSKVVKCSYSQMCVYEFMCVCERSAMTSLLNRRWIHSHMIK